MADTKGYTLLEMIVVMLIVGILITIVIVNYGSSIYNAQVQAVENNLRGIAAAQEKYYEDNGKFYTASGGNALTTFGNINSNLSLTMSTETVDEGFSYSCASSSGPPLTLTCSATNTPPSPSQINQVSIILNGINVNLTCSNSSGSVTCPDNV